jgi:hypothetical protein
MFYFLKKSIYIVILGFSYFIFSIVIDGLMMGYFKEQMVYDTVSIDLSLIYIWSIQTVAFMTFSLIIRKDIQKDYALINDKKLLKLAYLFFFLSFLTTIYKLYTSPSIIIMFTNPREWELAFGANSFLNYIYFLHVISGFIFTYLYVKYKRFKYLIFICISVFLSVFHGIKFTIIHALFMPLFLYLIMNNYKIRKSIVLVGIVFLFSMIYYFNNIRGGGLDGLIGYITSPSIQAIYLIQNSDFVINSPFGVYIPDFLSTLEHIYNKVTDSNFISAGTGKGFILNDKYNLVAPIFKVSTFSIISYILVLIYIAVIINYIKSIKIPTISILFIETLLIFSVFMLFMGWSFFALKLLFLIFIMLSIDWNIIIKKFLSVKGNL